jgi:hypothetical protein
MNNRKVWPQVGLVLRFTTSVLPELSPTETTQ